jgi:segregation and condensation protein B
MDDELAGQDGSGPPLPVDALVENLLFVAQEPVSVERLSAVLEINPEELEAVLSALSQEYDRRGLRLERHGRQVQMVTAPEAGDYVRRFLGLELTGKLSPAALETLAVVAYRQPVTRAEVEAVRGVNSDSVLRTLINRGLIEEQGRLDKVGRPIVYGTTFEFLQHFGLTGLEQLPPLGEGQSFS